MAFSLFRANVPIGYINVNGQELPVYAKREFVQALTSALRGLGGEGSDAVSFKLTSTGVSFTFDDPTDTTANSPDTITFNAVLTNMTGTATFTATAYDDSAVSLGTITLGGSGNERTLTKEQFNSLGDLETQYVVVAATLGSYSDSITVHRADLTGLTGNRGSRTFYEINAAYTSTYDIDGPGGIAAGTASYQAKSTLVVAAGLGATDTPTTPIKGDQVVFSNGVDFAYHLTNDGTYATTGNASWVEPGVVIDGDVLVNGTVTAQKINVINLAALSANLGTVTAGTISGTADLTIGGVATFNGSNTYSGSQYAVVINDSEGTANGLVAVPGSGAGNAALRAFSNNGTYALYATGSGAGDVAVRARAFPGATALQAEGPVTMDDTLTWNSYAYATPDGTAFKFPDAAGNWQALAKAIKYISTAATAGASLGYMTIDTLDGTGQVKVEIFATS